MIYLLEDIVFQNDRYFLLFSENEATELVDFPGEKYIITEHECIGKFYHCEISQILKFPDKIVLETKENLNNAENKFRRSKVVQIATSI
ncbi:hypothetical protein [Chryseobacterium caseinilyticum]|uniref:Uncharacterized protein n=1 Tax=Chryseobacterium caseinilyticum TaxID=2771428 RepID=A0ABR8ZB08_9FLAO|nr:hypothetical protein [Chryseobacterium caseinilyticum]MBD8082509.1 hypothetical protein [Chryseobacterium caseinilyticum]